MNKIVGRAALGILLSANGFVAAKASVPLPVIQQASGISSLAPMLKKITPAVVGVSIRSRTTGGNAKARKARDAKPVDPQARAVGSGVIIDARQGLIITNQHVIDRAEEITVQISDGRELAGKLVGADPDTDIGHQGGG